MRTHLFRLLNPTSLMAAAALAASASIAPPPTENASPFLLRETDVRAVVTGPVAHVTVTQKWVNPNPVPVDGLYIFPLPTSAAVNDMQLRIGTRTIRAEMKRREEARRIYEQARQEGRVAALLDAERPNAFAQRIANIMPGLEIDVVLAFDQEIRCEHDTCEYIFPTVVGPRFIPEHQLDPGSITPPVVESGATTGQRLSIGVEVDAGVEIHDLDSPSHRVASSRRDPTRARVTLARGDVAPLNRDFRLRWRVGGDRSALGILAWRDPQQEDEPGVFTLVLQPPASVDDAEAAPRELVFVLDCSGSMNGIPLAAAKNVVRRALRAVRPRDTFRILRFSDTASGLAPHPLQPSSENIQRALAYLDALNGEGGTRMIEGIKAALSPPADPDRLRIVAFLTDGYIGNEREILAAVRQEIGAARLFAFGIGSSVNRYLLEGLAEEGRGIAAFLGPRETPDEMVERFIARIQTPVMTDIRIWWEDLEVEDLEPARVPDLFAGQSVLIHGRYRKPATGVVVVSGKHGGRTEILRKVAVLRELERDHSALARLWARARIHRLDRELHDGPNELAREAITNLGLRHRLMTAWTSLVAVDSIVSNASGTRLQVEVPVEMPEDVSREAVFGGRTRLPASPAMARTIAVNPRAAGGVEGGVAGGVVGGVAGGVVGGAPEQVAPAIARRQDLSSSFIRLTLTLGDGRRILVEDDGEVWSLETRQRSLLRTLTTTELQALQLRLAAAGPGGWPAGPGRRNSLTAEGLWGTASLALPSAVPGVTAIVELLESWTR